ncbi:MULTISPECIES: OmpA family protein [unclassified Acidovorax]|uniref:OmpA family protein n=1 Tax=unclassified Acidovorax TaxID=2684926 RepID=UPI001C46477E|nr:MULTISPECIES: OmpA family protein [unclassified Acidovorax]MBV7431408.1 OmpA family protein [Acidovorax sp. sif0732]MBV7452557.1 OmpA family protein [Acidovorax sp. sif0715]
MHRLIQRTTALCTSLVAVGLLAACASTAPFPALEQARSAVSAVAGDPIVNQYAPVELKEATDALARADREWADDHDESETNHLAYIARQRAEIATNAARSRQLDASIQQASGDADRIRLQARTQEADQARLRAQQAQAQALNAEQRAAQQQANASVAMAQASAAQDRVRALEAQLRDMEAQQTERGLLVTLGDVLFAFNKAELSAQAGPRLDKLASFLKQFPDRKLLIEGYTDSVGSDGYNQDLSDRRAQSVRDALVQRGVDSSRITARGYGKAHPVADNASPEGRAMNRRVEIVIADDKGTLRGR